MESLVWTLTIPTIVFFGLLSTKFDGWKWYSKTISTLAYFCILMSCVIVFHGATIPDKSMAGLLAHALNTMMIAVTLIVVAVPEGLLWL